MVPPFFVRDKGRFLFVVRIRVYYQASEAGVGSCPAVWRRLWQGLRQEKRYLRDLSFEPCSD